MFVVASAIPSTATATKGIHLRTTETWAKIPEALIEMMFINKKNATIARAISPCPHRGTSETLNLPVSEAKVPIRISDPKNPSATTSAPR